MAKLFHQPLFNPKLIARRIAQQPTPAAHKQILHDWAETIRNGSIAKQKETSIRAPFLRNFFVELLGYTPFGSGADCTILDESQAGSGRSDAALGFFPPHEAHRIIAPVELKGADTSDLDIIMPGRHKSPVQQAWEYAMDIPGCQFVVLSNMLEIRLYAVGHTRLLYESWNILDLADSDSEYQRLQLLLGADNLLTGRTLALLKDSAAAEKDITQALYRDYKDWRIQLVIALAQHNPEVAFSGLIEHAQTILDRILFVAFAEDRGLLPAKTLAQAFDHRDPYNPRPVWENFKGLFKAIDQGNPSLGIPAYNGGLFRAAPGVDALTVPDGICRSFKKLGEYDFASEVSVSVLGHIFEQSISDLEELRELSGAGDFSLDALAGKAASGARSVSGKRKDEGVVYTPDAITAFIVEQTLGGYLTGRREQTRAAYLDPRQPEGEEIRYRKPSAEEKKNLKVRDAARLTEFLFWHHWRETLKTIRVVDPACGSGAFLVAAFDLLDAEYRQVNEQIQAITGNPDLFDINREILNGNLYGVDLNPESIEITKLSLWLKTARHGKPLESLEANLRVGNSLIGEINGGAEFSPRAFDWHSAFPEIFHPSPFSPERAALLPLSAGTLLAGAGRGAGGEGERGFDVVLGNPPYVRMERIKPIKPYLERHYRVASERADLYCYFYELGVNLLKEGGRLGYISSSTFFKTGSGEPLRRFLLEQTRLRVMVDFGDLQVFEGVTTYPAIVVLEKYSHTHPHPTPPLEGEGVIAPPPSRGRLGGGWGDGGEENIIRYLALKEAPANGLAAAFELQAGEMAQSRLGTGSWQLEDDASSRLRARLTAGHPTLKQVYGSPLYGIKTGFNEAFVVARASRDRLIAEDPRSAELLKPFLEGKDLKKWRIEPQDLWLIYIPKGRVNIDDYPAIRDHLLPFKDKLEQRATKQEWFELQQAQEAYTKDFKGTKIIYPEMSQGPKFSLDERGYFPINKIFHIPTTDWFLVGLLNSQAAWHYLFSICSALRGGEWRLELRAQYVETVPVPAVTDAQRAEIAALAEACQRAAETRRDAQSAFARRIPDLAPAGGARLSTKLHNWWKLDFAAFRTEIKKGFKQDIPLAERNDWERYFLAEQAKIKTLDGEIASLERRIDQAVYCLFDLSAAEIALIAGE